VVDTIKSALTEAKAKLDKLVEERRKIDEQIVNWKRVVDSLCAVSEDVSDTLPPDIEVIVRAQALAPFEAPSDKNPKSMDSPSTRISFTDAIRSTLRTRELRVVPVPEIRDELVACGFDFSKYKQKLVPIHNTLKRLEEQGEVRAVKNEQGRVKGYQWIGPIERAIKEENEFGRGVPEQMYGTIRDTIRRLVRENEGARELFKRHGEKMQ
jgi:hypothetical protein